MAELVLPPLILEPLPSPAPAETEDDVRPELGEVMSASQVRTWMDCAARGMFRFVYGIRETQNLHLAVGKALHEGVLSSMAYKVETSEDLPVEEVVEITKRTAIALLDEPIRLDDDESPQDVIDESTRLAELYMREAAPSIEPLAVEMQVTGVIGGVATQAWIDILDVNGRIIDLKTAGRTPNAVSRDQKLQLATYYHLTPGAGRDVRVDSLVKNKTPKLVQLEHRLTDSDLRGPETLFPRAQALARGGIYMPNRTSNLCSRSGCAYWDHCQAEFGGLA